MHGIVTIDTGFKRQGFDAAYLIIEQGRGAIIDCGTRHSEERILNAVLNAGLAPQDIDYLILTHVHLDHAGGAGALMQHLPQAQLVVHPRGAPHMVDPSKLWAGALAVYGEEEMLRSYGKLEPVAIDRVISTTDGMEISLNGRSIVCLDTPGHAYHHNALYDPTSQSVFSGDTFGLSYREFDTAQGAYILPTTSPIDFDPGALHQSIERLVQLQPERIYLTHYNQVTEIRRLADDLHRSIDAMAEIAVRHEEADKRHARIKADLDALYKQQLAAHGCTLPMAVIDDVLATDIELNAQGLGVWLERRKKRAQREASS